MKEKETSLFLPQLKDLFSNIEETRSDREELSGGKGFIHTEKKVSAEEVAAAREQLKVVEEQLVALENALENFDECVANDTLIFTSKNDYVGLGDFMDRMKNLLDKSLLESKIKNLTDFRNRLSESIEKREKEIAESPEEKRKVALAEITADLAALEAGEEITPKMIVSIVRRQEVLLAALSAKEAEPVADAPIDESATSEDEEEEKPGVNLDALMTEKLAFEGSFEENIIVFLAKDSLNKNDNANLEIYFLAFLEAMSLTKEKNVSPSKLKTIKDDLKESFGIKDGYPSILEEIKELLDENPDVTKLDIFSSENIDKYAGLLKKLADKKDNAPEPEPEPEPESAPDFVTFKNFSLDKLADMLKEKEEGFQTKLSEEDLEKILKIMTAELKGETFSGVEIISVNEPSVEIKGQKCIFNIDAVVEKEVGKGLFKANKKGPINIKGTIRNISGVEDGLNMSKPFISSPDVIIQTGINLKRGEIDQGLDKVLGDINESLSDALKKEINKKGGDLSQVAFFIKDGHILAGFNQEISLESAVESKKRVVKKKNEEKKPAVETDRNDAEPKFSFKEGMNDFEKSYNLGIEPDHLGEYGMDASENSEGKTTEMNFWLFDSNSNKRKEIVLIAPNMEKGNRDFLKNNYTVYEPVTGETISIAAGELVMDIIIRDVQFDDNKKYIKKLDFDTKVIKVENEVEDEEPVAPPVEEPASEENYEEEPGPSTTAKLIELLDEDGDDL